MIFLVLFAIIAVVVIALNMHDSSNLQKIEDYLNTNSCEEIVYDKGSYKAFCSDKIIQIPNSFSVDIQNDKKQIKFSEIKNITKDDLTIIINKNYKIEFKEKEKLNRFQKRLEDKLNK